MIMVRGKKLLDKFGNQHRETVRELYRTWVDGAKFQAEKEYTFGAKKKRFSR